MAKPRALDLFCGAGGAAMGLSRAGFEVVGVDLLPQPRYPFEFIEDNALRVPLDGFDFIWASPVCKHFSRVSLVSRSRDNWSDLITPIRQRLKEWGGPYIIENVPDAPLIDPIELCGRMFGLELYRHRHFESNVELHAPEHPVHRAKVAKLGRPAQPGAYVSVVGNFSGVEQARAAMGIEWMTGTELSQAIPPAFSEYLGRAILAHLGR
jgi:DNA (cytosine-5)-methyltransferase 1